MGVETTFKKRGLNVEVMKEPPRRFGLDPSRFYADVVGVGRNERIRIWRGDSKFDVLNVSKETPHILCHVEVPTDRVGIPGGKRKILFGHDERHLFVAEIGKANISTAREAIAALRPDVARDAAKRQGEWFFRKMPDVHFGKDAVVLHKEPITRTRQRKPHVAQDLVRVLGTHGEVSIYVRGKITHPDHSTVTLDGWHLVIRNAEGTNPVHNFVD